MRLRFRDISPFILAISSSDSARSYSFRARLSNESRAPDNQQHVQGLLRLYSLSSVWMKNMLLYRSMGKYSVTTRQHSRRKLSVALTLREIRQNEHSVRIDLVVVQRHVARNPRRGRDRSKRHRRRRGVDKRLQTRVGCHIRTKPSPRSTLFTLALIVRVWVRGRVVMPSHCALP